MSRIRTIKPEFWASQQVGDCALSTRLFFIGLWNFCDDEGRTEVRLRQLKVWIFPFDDFSIEDIRRMLDELSSNGLVKLYHAENKEYLQVTGWHHQKIDRATPSKLPEPIGEHSPNHQRAFAEPATIVRRPLATYLPTEGREGGDLPTDRPTEGRKVEVNSRAPARAKAEADKRPASLASPCRPNGGSAARGPGNSEAASRPRRQPEIPLLPHSDPLAPSVELTQEERQARIAALEELKKELQAGTDPWAPKR